RVADDARPSLGRAGGAYLADDGAAQGRAAGGRRGAGGGARLTADLRPCDGADRHRGRRHGGPRPTRIAVAAESSSAAPAPPPAAGMIAVSPWPWSQKGHRQPLLRPWAPSKAGINRGRGM